MELLKSELYNHYDLLRTITCNYVIPDPECQFEGESTLLLKDEDRSCTITIHGLERKPKYMFEWDECSLFEISSDETIQVGNLITHWICHKLPPSKIKIQFPEIELNNLAEYYENGEGIKGEFIESWNDIEHYYSEIYSEDYKTMQDDTLRLIKELRAIGLDEKLRAGQALTSFIISRSRRYGLTENAPYVMINFQGHNQMVINYYLNTNEDIFGSKATMVTGSFFNSKEKRIKSEVTYKGDLEKLIRELLKEKIK